jgi:acylphosphatase
VASRIHLRISGKVQRVGFRWFAREQARRCELAGWVKNNPDGSVELMAAGDDECIARFRIAVGTGPDGARVDDVRSLPTENGDLPFPFQMVR